MSKRLTFILIIGLALVLSAGLTACEKERPVPTPSRSTPAPARGTVAPTVSAPTALTQVAPSALSGAAAGQATPVPASAATSTAPAPQTVVVNPATAGSTTGGQTTTYMVVEGDTLASIAAKFGTTQAAIAQLNNMTDLNALTIGQELKIPGQETTGSTGAAGTTTYVVEAGDTLAAIARRFNTTIGQLIQLNNLANPDIISVGQTLIVPAGAGTTSETAEEPAEGSTTEEGETYVVQSGDTLMKIARKYGVTLQQLQAANKITDPDRIYPGQVLVIP